MITSALLLLCLASSTLATCPEGTTFDSQFNKCYKYVPLPTSFLLAEKYCENFGGSLVSVSSAFENSYISLIASQYGYGNTSFWIGINSIYYPKWTWINWDSSTYRNWAQNQPDASYQCGTVQPTSSLWTTSICNDRKPYMCQIDLNPGKGCPNGRCSADYTLNPKTCKCYKYTGYNGPRSNAQDRCRQENATLPIIMSQTDNDFITFTYPNQNVWLDLYCSANSTASCTWPDGTHLQGYTNFNPGFPSGQPFPFTFVDSSNGKWDSGPINYSNAAVCQTDGIS